MAAPAAADDSLVRKLEMEIRPEAATAEAARPSAKPRAAAVESASANLPRVEAAAELGLARKYFFIFGSCSDLFLIFVSITAIA